MRCKGLPTAVAFNKHTWDEMAARPPSAQSLPTPISLRPAPSHVDLVLQPDAAVQRDYLGAPHLHGAVAVWRRAQHAQLVRNHMGGGGDWGGQGAVLQAGTRAGADQAVLADTPGGRPAPHSTHQDDVDDERHPGGVGGGRHAVAVLAHHVDGHILQRGRECGARWPNLCLCSQLLYNMPACKWTVPCLSHAQAAALPPAHAPARASSCPQSAG